MYLRNLISKIRLYGYSSRSLTRYDNFSYVNSLRLRLDEVNENITDTFRLLFQAQQINIKTTVVRPKGFFQNITNRYYQNMSQNSVNLYLQQLRKLILLKFQLQYKLYLISGPLFVQISKLILFALLALGGCFVFGFFLISGFLATLYILPFLLILYFISILINRK